MIIEQTVEIPASRRLTIDVPREVPTGRAKAALTLTFETGKSGKTQKAAALKNLIGCCANTGDSLNAYMERHWADNDRERAAESRRKAGNEKDRGRSGK